MTRFEEMSRSAIPARAAATGLGISAILMWATLAVLTAASGATPPFLLLALAFGISGVGGMAWLGVSGRAHVLFQPWTVWLHGVGGLFGYHFLYFSALRLAPPVEAGLVNYLWPLLIVLFSGLLPGERLKWHHLAGAGIGFAGVVLAVGGGGRASFSADHAAGYAAAFLAAIVWAVYSVTARLLQAVPASAVAGFCLATALLAAPCHLAFEPTIWPDGLPGWAAVLGLGIFPVGLAFFAWDKAMKRGAIQVVGAASYLTPILSTLLLIAAGYGTASLAVLLAAGLVSAGALLAARDMLFPGRRRSGSGWRGNGSSDRGRPEPPRSSA